MSDNPPTPVWLCTRCDWYTLFGIAPQFNNQCRWCGAQMRESVWSEEPRIKSSKELLDHAMEMQSIRDFLARMSASGKIVDTMLNDMGIKHEPGR